MKKFNLTGLLLFSFFLITALNLPAQDSFYNLKSVKKVVTSPSRDLQRPGSCWSNAGTAFLEAEMLKAGKKDVDLSEMDFIHNTYLLKAGSFLNSKGTIKLKQEGLPSDVIYAMKSYGMVPESAYMKSEKDPMSDETVEMDAILQGTLRMVLDTEKGNFTEKWKNIYNSALQSYIGEAMINFKVNDQDFTPKSYAEKAGLKADDYILVTADSKQEPYKSFVLPAKNNWAQESAFNVAFEDLTKIIQSAVEKGFTVVWGGDVVKKTIFESERIALVPQGRMPGEKVNDTTKIVKEPVAERIISTTERQEKYQSMLNSDSSYWLIYGLSKDSKGSSYFTAKNICKSGDEVLNLSDSYVKLNTLYLLLNKNALPDDIKVKLGF